MSIPLTFVWTQKFFMLGVVGKKIFLDITAFRVSNGFWFL